MAVAIIEISSDHLRIRADTPAGAKSEILSIHIEELRLPLKGRVEWSRPGGNGATFTNLQVIEGAEHLAMVIEWLLEHKRAERIDELRVADRFRLAPPIPVVFSTGGNVELIDLSETGARLRTSSPVKPTARGNLKLTVDNRPILDAPARVVWSKATQEGGRLSYASGVRIENAELELRNAIQILVAGGRSALDTESLSVKLQIMRTRALQRARELSAHIREQSVRTDEHLLIDHVREQLRTYPDEAQQWYNRAKYAASQESVRAQLLPTLTHRDEILAVWEYLERSVELGTIIRYYQEQTESRSRIRWKE